MRATIFTLSALGAQRVGTEANFNAPEAHMAMLESLGAAYAEPLIEGRFIIMPLDPNGVAKVAASVDADYLVRDPRPGEQQEILRFNT